jgi:hypothetical protein
LIDTPNTSHRLSYTSKFEQFSVLVAMAAGEVTALTLASICLAVQIGICMFLYPSDILALRMVCRHQKFSLLVSEVLLFIKAVTSTYSSSS